MPYTSVVLYQGKKTQRRADIGKLGTKSPTNAISIVLANKQMGIYYLEASNVKSRLDYAPAPAPPAPPSRLVYMPLKAFSPCSLNSLTPLTPSPHFSNKVVTAAHSRCASSVLPSFTKHRTRSGAARAHLTIFFFFLCKVAAAAAAGSAGEGEGKGKGKGKGGGGIFWMVVAREVDICAMWEIAGSRVLVAGVSGSMELRI